MDYAFETVQARQNACGMLRRLWLLASLTFVGMATWIVLSSSATGDYGSPRCAHLRCDDAAPSLHALAGGDVAGFFRAQQDIGLTSLLLRAPAVAVARAAGASTAGEYRAGALVCMVATALLAVWLAYLARRGGAPVPSVVGFLVLVAVLLLWSRSLFFGHPEEPLAAMLALLAAMLALDGRPLGAGVALGLAIATKEWALLAAPGVVFCAAPAVWKRTAVAAVAIAAVLTATMAVASPDSFRAAHDAQSHAETRTVTPASAWFRLGHKKVVAASATAIAYVVYPPREIGRWCRELVVLLAALTAVLFVRRRGFGSPDALALIALAFVMRSVLDTQVFSYHVEPMLLAVAAWEVAARQRVPVVAAAAIACFELTARVVAPHMSADAFNAIYLGWTLPLAAYMGVVALGAPSAAPGWPTRAQTLFSSLCQ
jgi:hypothetical protein